ncbi:MAG: DUF885 domain-containing protein, partial [Candidatus Lokiarchaeota archaeon]|nr:DUF885 domain-containing protein [Candidatus Lokiarchaeota archaeon]
KRNPRIAVLFGKEEYEKVVESGTKEHIVENLKWFSQWIDELKQLDIEKLNFENKISLKAMEYYHNINLFKHEDFPLWKKDPNGLAYFQEILYLLFQRKGPTTDLAETLIIHITNLPNYLEEFQSRFDNTPIPVVWRDLALETIETTPKILKTVAEAYSETSEVTPSLKNKLLEAFKEVESVIQNHVKWIKNLPVDTGEFAWALGPEKFDKLLSLRKLPWDRKTLISKGNKLFSLGFKKIKRILKELYPNKTLSEGIKEFFEEDLIPSFQEVLEYTQSEAERAKEFIKNHNLATIPQDKLLIIETPPHIVPILPGAAYEQAPYFNREQPGIFMISPTQKEFQSYTYIPFWMVHEAYPGHHLDFATNNAFAPLIRLLGVSMETAEGWAIYCEEMMLQEGFYKNHKKSQQLISGVQVQEAMNLILDIQLHCRQRSISDAIKTKMNILSLREVAARGTVVEITRAPGYPLSYLVGKLLINDLRQEVEEKMGDNFNLKFFHDTILRSGDLPYYLLKEYFEEKIKNL